MFVTTKWARVAVLRGIRLLPRGANKSDTHAWEAICIQLFRERLSEKVYAAISEGIVGGFEFAVLPKEI